MKTTLHIAFLPPQKAHAGCPKCECWERGWSAYVFATVPMTRKAWMALPPVRFVTEWIWRARGGGWVVGRGKTQAEAVADLRRAWKARVSREQQAILSGWPS